MRARVQSGDRDRARAASVASTRRSLSHFVLPSFPKSVSGLLASNLEVAHLLHFNQNKPICVLNSAQPKCKVSCASAVSCFIWLTQFPLPVEQTAAAEHEHEQQVKFTWLNLWVESMYVNGNLRQWLSLACSKLACDAHFWGPTTCYMKRGYTIDLVTWQVGAKKIHRDAESLAGEEKRSEWVKWYAHDGQGDSCGGFERRRENGTRSGWRLKGLWTSCVNAECHYTFNQGKVRLWYVIYCKQNMYEIKMIIW